MHYEHRLRVNDVTVPEPLNRTQLWRGLLLRAEDPVPFVDGLDVCTIIERGERVLERELRFGRTLIRDRVSLTAQHSIHIDIRDRMGITEDSLHIRIEEPTPGDLFLRFVYRVTLSDAITEASPEADVLREVYHGVDLDTVMLIRRYALAGRLGDPDTTLQ